MKIFIPKILDNVSLIDILGGPTQVFQSQPWMIKPYITESLREANFAVAPHDAAHWTDTYLDYLKTISEKVVLLYFNRSDFPRNINIPNSFSLQNHVSKSAMQCQIIIPYNVRSISHLPKRLYNEVPTVSFAGYIPRLVSKSLLQHIKQDSLDGVFDNPNLVRRLGIHRLKHSELQNIVLLRSHYGGARSLITDVRQFRKEYETSISDSDFVFCPRGVGNSSQRFYEALSAGRIPIVPNTNQVYPTIGDLGLREVFVEIAKFSGDLEVRVREIWNKLNVLSYNSLQDHARQLFREHLAYEPFLKKMFHELSQNRTLKNRAFDSNHLGDN